ncbi:MAG: hypothetical protein LBQ19_01450 [Synergistaceae bacterium]|jgi:hypothetical protein|nr:hypothetical protein [Synergistaceae bacterium]
MSAQMNDRIKYKGSDYGLAATPLENYFSDNPELRPKFAGFNSACRRGYVARWEIIGEKLRLVGMDMVLQTDATFESLFPDAGEGVFADWVSGELPCHHGKYFRRNALDFSPVPEFTLTLEVENGVVKSTNDRKNEIPS